MSATIEVEYHIGMNSVMLETSGIQNFCAISAVLAMQTATL
jgi:carbonic anhydrase/acetyltransferase-like protein (isoleucine patch superfamily)